MVHWHLSKVFSLPLSSSTWFSHCPPPVSENAVAKVLWDFSLISEGHYPNNCPDIVLFNYKKRNILFIEVSCPADINVPSKEKEKVYKYQPLARDFHSVYHMCCKETVLAEFERRLRLVWRSLLYGNYKVQATNSFCVPLLFGVVDWTVAELNKMDILVRKVMREVCSLHPRSAIERLYLSHNRGGCGLLNVEHLYYRRVICYHTICRLLLML